MMNLNPGKELFQKERRRHSLCSTFLLALLALFASGNIRCLAQDEFSEAEVKAAFIVRAASFVDWPAGRFNDEKSPIRIAVLGKDEMVTELERFIKAQKSLNRPFTVRKISNAFEALEAEMLFIGESETKRTAQIVDLLKDTPVLTFGESQEFFENGGMVHLFLEKDHLRFQVNLASAEQAKLNLSSKLLTLAKRVVRGGPKK